MISVGRNIKRLKLGGNFSSMCKKCERNYKKLYRETNKEKIREYKKEYYQNNLDHHKQYCKLYYKNNIELFKINSKQWREDNRLINKIKKAQYAKDNPDGCNRRTALYKARKLNANVPWANQEIISFIYKECAELNKLYPLINGKPKFHVDHYYPLQSKFVCGLHHENNLHITTMKDNCSKCNKFPKEDICLNRTMKETT